MGYILIFLFFMGWDLIGHSNDIINCNKNEVMNKLMLL